MRFGTWNVRSLYRSGSLKTVARELAKYKLDLVGVQEVRWDKEGTVRAGEYTFFFQNGSARSGIEGGGAWTGLS
jgi:exonuclease III